MIGWLMKNTRCETELLLMRLQMMTTIMRHHSVEILHRKLIQDVKHGYIIRKMIQKGRGGVGNLPNGQIQKIGNILKKQQESG